jgi:starch synthase
MSPRVLAVTSELFPLIKTGGLADVAGALPPALAELGCRVHTLLPAYPGLAARCEGVEEILRIADLPGGPGRLLAARMAGLELLLLDAPQQFERPGNPYLGPDGQDWPDNPLRFAALAWAARALALGAVPALRFDLLHAHDWQAGLAPAYLALADQPRPATVLTVHNLAFHGLAEPALIPALRLPPAAFAMHGYECWGKVGFLKAGLYYADAITTVSPTYAHEITTPEHGMGLDGLLRARRAVLHGILNGIDTAVWDPATDPHLPRHYGAADLAGKAVCKHALQQRLGLAPDPARPLLGAISRLTRQKGLDLAVAVLPPVLDRGAQLALLGSGEADLEAAYQALALRHPGQVGLVLGYDEPLAHLIQAGADALLVPSRFEPCGLTQLCALRYGTLPVVARVGGLADTVIDANPAAMADGVATGVQFLPVTTDGLAHALERLLALWAQPELWRRLVRHALGREVGWRRPAAAYLALYRQLVEDRP